MKVNDFAIDPGPSVYYDQSFRNTLEAHMTFLRTHSTTTTISVEPMKAYKYEFDFFSLLAAYNVPAYLHWLVMRMNNMTSPMDATRQIESLLIPDVNEVDKIRQSHMTTRRVS